MSYIVEKSTERLMPHGWCWNGARIGAIKELTNGLSVDIDRGRIDGENIVRDYYSDTTTFLNEWEKILALPPVDSLTDAQRRNRIQAARSLYPTNTFTGQASFINLSGFNVRVIPLEIAQDPSAITSVLELIIDGRYRDFLTPPSMPVDSDYWPLMYIVENLDGTPISLTDDEYSAIRFLILKAKPPFMWCILRGALI